MIAVTIAYGDRYVKLARTAARRMTRMSGLETHVLGEEHLDRVAQEFPRYHDLSHAHRIYLLKFWLFDFFPDEDRIVYFDLDWSPIRSFPVSELTQGDFCAVLDRTSVLLRQQDRYASDCGNYFNAGMFSVSRGNGSGFLEHCRVNYDQCPVIQWGDQCVMNYFAESFQMDLRLLPRIWNVMDHHGMWKDCDIIGVHSKYNFDLFEHRVMLDPDPEYFWDTAAMAEEARYPHTLDGAPISLRPDGTRSDGQVWFIDQTGRMHHMTFDGNRLHDEVLRA